MNILYNNTKSLIIFCGSQIFVGHAGCVSLYHAEE